MMIQRLFVFGNLFLSLTRAFSFISSKQNSKLSLSMLNVGDVAPEFELKNSVGKLFKLSSFKGKQPVVVFFYPNDNTPGCTKEVCAFEKKVI
jgi:peroxiredoxin